MKHLPRSFFAFLTAFCLCTGCSAPAAQTEPVKTPESTAASETVSVPSQEPEMTDETDISTPEDIEKAKGGKPWPDSQMKENITEGMERSPKDNYYLYVNYDFHMDMKNGGKKKNTSKEIADEMLEVMQDDHSDNHAQQLVQQYYRAFTDWDTRNKAGLEPLRAVVEDIRGISTLDELTEFLSDPSRSINVPLLLRYVNYQEYGRSHNYTAAVYFRGWGELLLQDPHEYDAETRSEDTQLKYDKFKAESVYYLTGLGWSEADAVQAFENCIAAETAMCPELESLMDLMQHTYEEDAVSLYASADQIQEWMKNYPFKRIAEARGYGNAEEYYYTSEAYMRLLGDYYTEEHLEQLKAYHLITYLLAFGWTCDEESYLTSENALKDPDFERPEDHHVVFNKLKFHLPEAVDNAYLARYDQTKLRDAMLDFFREFKAIYHDMISEAEWMSDETKVQVLDKVDAMQLFAVCPEHLKEYEDLSFDGMNFAEIALETDRYQQLNAASLVGKEIIPDEYAWSIMSTLEDNARAFPEFDGLMFTLGILKDGGYSPDMSTEELYGVVGTALAHEISHCFDENGARITKEGEVKDWWKEEDLEEFRKRVQKVVDFYDGITICEGVQANGSMISAEATADITGMQATLKLAEKQENFDYDEFFRSYAWLWRIDSSYKRDMMILKDDPHPLGYLRVNTVVQQFDEFYETYDVKEGDGMYLAPEDRIVVW